MIRGAGGLSIAPNLQIQSVWEVTSERYDEVWKITREPHQNGLLIPTLLRAFSDQRLSPYDTFYYPGIGIESLMDVCSQTPLPKTWLLLKIGNLVRSVRSVRNK